MGDGVRDGNVGAAVASSMPVQTDDLEALLAAADDAESSGEEIDPIREEELQGPHTESLARRLAEAEARELRRIQRLRRQKKRLKVALTAFKQKEKEFVTQMDAHMDEVERTEQDLSKRIEGLTAENQQLRERTERRARENSEQVEKLNETTKQCGESETRVQFLVDRIVALLSAGAADPSQTEAVMNLRQRERDMLRMLEETRQQFDEVRQQNGELATRLTEELNLSRRLSDQLAEVEERFFHQKPEDLCIPRSPCGSEQPSLRPQPRLGARPLGLRSDPLEAPPERPERAHPPDLPPTIGEVEEETSFEESPESQVPIARTSGGHAARRTLGAVLEAEADDEQRDSEEEMMEGEAEYAEEEWDGEEERMEEEGEHEGEAFGGGLRTPYTEDTWSGVPSGATSPTARAELMEGKLRGALDKAAFECAVVRVETGVYNFGPSVQAVVELTASEEVVASRNGGPFEPIDNFIMRVAEESRRASSRQSLIDEGSPTPPQRHASPPQPAAATAPAPAAPQPQAAPAAQAAPTAAPQPQAQDPAMRQPQVLPPVTIPAARACATASPRPAGAGPSIFACSGGSAAGASMVNVSAASGAPVVAAAPAGQQPTARDSPRVNAAAVPAGQLQREAITSPRATSPAPLTAPRYVAQSSPRPGQWQPTAQTAPGATVAAMAPGSAAAGQNAAWATVAALRAGSPTGDMRGVARQPQPQVGLVPSLAIPMGAPVATASASAPPSQMVSPRPQALQQMAAASANPRLVTAANAGAMRMGVPQVAAGAGRPQGGPQQLYLSV